MFLTNQRTRRYWRVNLSLGESPDEDVPKPELSVKVPKTNLGNKWKWLAENASKDKCSVGQMPVLAFVHRGICPPGICPSRHLSAPPPRISVGSGICPDQMWVQAFVLLAFVRSKIDSRHLSSWHLSDKKLPPGICPPGICPTKKCVQAFVLLAFVRPKSDSWHLSSWHLSDQKMTPGICPPGICPTKKSLKAFVLLAFVRPKKCVQAFVLLAFVR